MPWRILCACFTTRIESEPALDPWSTDHMAIKPNPPLISWLESPLRDLQDHRRLPDHIALQALVLLQARHRVSGADRARPHHSGPGTSASSLPPSRDFDCLLKSYNILRLDFRPRQMVLTRCCRSASPNRVIHLSGSNRRRENVSGTFLRGAHVW